jgi:predicted Zn-ribbon and HTH transcriptional regulator
MIEEAACTLCGYEVVSHRVEIIGICPDCRAMGNPDSETAS